MKTLSYNFFDLKTVHVHSKSDQILEEVDNLFGNFRNNGDKPLPEDEEQVFLEEITEGGWKYAINWNSDSSEAITLNPSIFSFNCFVNQRILASLPFIFVHASVVSLNNDVLVFLGDSNYGKTTTCFALVSQGFQYLSDEYAVFDLAKRKALPYPRGGFLSPTSLSLLNEVHEKFTRYKNLSCQDDIVINPLSLFPQDKIEALSCNKIWFFIIQPEYKQQTEIIPASQAEVFKSIALLSKNFSQVYRTTGEKIISDLYKIIRSSHCFYLKQGKPANTVKTIQTILKNSKPSNEKFPLDVLLKQVRKELKF